MVALRAPVEAMTQWVVGYKAGVGLDYFENYQSMPPLPSAPPERARLVLEWCPHGAGASERLRR